MQVSETFSKVVGIALLLVALVACLLFLAQFIPPNHVHAQNNGNFGIQPTFQPVFKNQFSTASSAIFQDIGQGETVLFFCNTAFAGVIDLEWSPNGSTPFFVITQASYGSQGVDSSCHRLQFGGYFPNVRSTVTPITGSLNAWVTGLAAPISGVDPGLGTNGPAAPIVCDQSTTFVSIANGTTIGNAGVGPQNTGDTVVICGFLWSFAGATGATGTVGISWAAGSACTSPLQNLVINTTAATPQVFSALLAQRSPLLTKTWPCMVNNSGSVANVSISWASVHGL